MATMQQQRPKVETNTWSSMMPNPTISIVQSESFVKKLIALGISNVTYLRAIFPERAYCDRQLEGIRLKILRTDGSCPAASQVISWLKGAFDAFSKKYLRQLILAIHADGTGPDDALETYTFHFTYKNEDMTSCSLVRKNNQTNENVVSNLGCSIKEIRNNTLEMLRTTVQVTQSLPVLPNNCGISMKLLYYDERLYSHVPETPNDYDPPGFFSVENSSFMFPSESLNIRIGELSTPYHSLKFNGKMETTKFERFKCDNKKQVQNENSLMRKEQKEESHLKLQSTKHLQDSVTTKDSPLDSIFGPQNEEQNKTDSVVTEDFIPSTEQAAIAKSHLQPGPRQPAENVDVPTCSPAQPAPCACAGISPSMDVTPSEVREMGVHCACAIEKDGGIMVQCTACNRWQHGACYGLCEKPDDLMIHVCGFCHTQTQQCTDPKLLSLSTQQRQEICLYRRTLLSIQLCRVSVSFIMTDLDVSKDIAELLFKHLEDDGVLRPVRGKGQPRSVNQKVLKCVLMPRYFGPTADFSQHKYSFKRVDPMDCSTNGLKDMSLTPNTSECGRQKRVHNKMELQIEEEGRPSRKRQKTSQTEKVY